MGWGGECRCPIRNQHLSNQSHSQTVSLHHFIPPNPQTGRPAEALGTPKSKLQWTSGSASTDAPALPMDPCNYAFAIYFGPCGGPGTCSYEQAIRGPRRKQAIRGPRQPDPCPLWSRRRGAPDPFSPNHRGTNCSLRAPPCPPPPHNSQHPSSHPRLIARLVNLS
jgi:hypothetical protein